MEASFAIYEARQQHPFANSLALTLFFRQACHAFPETTSVFISVIFLMKGCQAWTPACERLCERHTTY